MSKAKAVEYRKYLAQKAVSLPGSYCEWPEKQCLNQATEIHHAKGRHGALLNDKTFWWLLCHEHHAWIHDHPNKARQIEGLLLI